MVDESGKIFTSCGTLHYEQDKIFLVVDPEIVRYYRSLIPRYIDLQPQKYPPHISVMRHEEPPHLGFWRQHEGEEVEFSYSNIVRFGKVYAWVNAFSKRLEDVRIELGLPVSSIYTRPPEGWTKCFHITLGNFKG